MQRILCFFLCFFCQCLCQTTESNEAEVSRRDLTLIHVNDLYSAFSGVKPDNTLCDIEDNPKDCFGGAPKLVAKINELRRKGILRFINAGNSLGGQWYKHLGPKIVTQFYKGLEFDAIALGLSDLGINYDMEQFNSNILNVTEFIGEMIYNTRLLACNVEADQRYISNFYSGVRKSSPLHRSQALKVATIGFMKPPKNGYITIDGHNYVNITDPFDCLTQQSLNLKKNGFNVIIAVGSGDQKFFRDIAEKVELIDLVIGSYGHNKDLSLLSQRTSDSYPDYVVNGKNGQRIVVTADVFGRSYGQITLSIDSNGNIKSSEGSLVPLDATNSLDESTQQLVDRYLQILTVGKTDVYLNGEDCPKRECNLGNVITDSMMFDRNTKMTKRVLDDIILREGSDYLKQQIHERRDAIALINSNLISDSIGSKDNLANKITRFSIDKVFANGDPKVILYVVRGTIIRQLLEKYVQSSHLLQVSGINVTYDLSKPINQTVIEISVKCTKCVNNTIHQFNDNNFYELLLPETIKLNEDNDTLRVTLLRTSDILVDYIRLNSPINTTIENRITFLNGKNDAFGAKSEVLMTLFFALIAVCHLRYYN